MKKHVKKKLIVLTDVTMLFFINIITTNNIFISILLTPLCIKF